MSASEATKDVECYRRLQEEVDALPDGSPRPPTKLYVDNQAAIASAYNPEHHGKLKHVERRHFYIREAIEAHRLCVPFVRSETPTSPTSSRSRSNPGGSSNFATRS